MKKIRVAFFLNLTENWLGGVNYFRNLLSIIVEDKTLNIEPVIFVSPDSNKTLLKGFPKVEIIETELLKIWGVKWFFSRIICKIFKQDVLIRRLLKKYNIDIVSHVQSKLLISDIPLIAWIPDFQHKHLPEMFSKNDLQMLDKSFESMSSNCDCVLLSSYDAKEDFDKYYPSYINKARVLQFVVPVNAEKYDANILRKKYSIHGDFFYLPNQFWAHKNHKVVLKTLNHLKKKKIDLQVVCTGNTEDYRNREYFLSLKQYIKENSLEKNFLILGKIPYEDVQVLTMEAKALINPSKFEGWSTTVEEAKSLGKRIILSDINVHKEQNPAGGYFFSNDDAVELGEVMLKVWNDEERDSILQNKAKIDLKCRKDKVRSEYRNILEFVLKK